MGEGSGGLPRFGGELGDRIQAGFWVVRLEMGKDAVNQVFSVNCAQYNVLSVIFYNILSMIPAPLRANKFRYKAQGIDSKRLWLDVYRVQNHRIGSVSVQLQCLLAK